MNIKKLISTVLVSTILLSGVSAMAADNSEQQLIANKASAQIVPANYTGLVKEVISSSSKITAIIIEEDDTQKTLQRFNIANNTAIIDNNTGVATDLKNLKKEDKIGIIASPFSTRSIPPQSSTYVVLTNIENSSTAKLLRIEDITKKEDGTFSLIDDAKMYKVAIDKDTVLLPYRTKQIVKPESLNKNDFVLVWADFMTMSIPAQMTAKKLVLLSGVSFYGQNVNNVSKDSVIVDVQKKTVLVNGKEVKVSEAKTPLFYKNKFGIYMYQLKSIAEALGYKVKWVVGENRVDVTKDNVSYSLDTCDRNQCSAILKKIPEFEFVNGRTYVTKDYFESTLNINFTVKD